MRTITCPASTASPASRLVHVLCTRHQLGQWSARLALALGLPLAPHRMPHVDEPAKLQDAHEQRLVFALELARQAAELLAIDADEPAIRRLYSAAVSGEDAVEGGVLGKGISAPVLSSPDSHTVVARSRSARFSGVTGGS